MAKPSTVGTYATDTNYSSGPNSGTATKATPSAGYLAQGFIAGQALMAQYFNYLFNLLFQWTAYLDNLHNEVQFLNKTYIWSGSQTFDNGAGLGNTTTEIAYNTARTRTIALPVALGSGYGDIATGAYASRHPAVTGIRLLSAGASTFAPVWTRPLTLPVGAIVTGWKAVVTGDAAGTIPVEVRFMRRLIDTTTATLPAASNISTASAVGPSRAAIAGSAGLPHTIATGYEYFFEFSNNSTGTLDSTVHCLEITFTETRATGHY